MVQKWVNLNYIYLDLFIYIYLDLFKIVFVCIDFA